MTDIEVILDDNQSVNIYKLSEEERTVIFENLEKVSELGSVIIQSFNDLVTESIQFIHDVSEPKTLDLLVNKVISLRVPAGIIIPVVGSKTGGKDVSNTQSEPNVQSRPNIQSGPNIQAKIVKTRFDTIVRVSKNNRTIMIPPGEEITIVSLEYMPVNSISGFKQLQANVYSVEQAKYLFDYVIEQIKYTMSPSFVVSKGEISGDGAQSTHVIPVAFKESSDPILVRLSKGLNMRFPEDMLTSMSVLYQYSIDRIFYNSELLGIDHKDTLSMIQMFQQKRLSKKFILDVKKKHFEEETKLNVYKNIILQKIRRKATKNATRAITMAKSWDNIYSTNQLLSTLSKDERNAVEKEYEQRKKYLAAMVNNKCAHVPIYKKLRRANQSKDERKYLAELREFFSTYASAHASAHANTTHNKVSAATSPMITCKVCKFDIICPHYIEIIESRGRPMIELKARLLKYIDDAQSKDQYYCKICGEILTQEVFHESMILRDVMENITDELKTMMWGEISSLLQLLKFNAIINMNNLIKKIIESISPFIIDIEKQILKSKTSGAEEIKSKKRLYVVIYAFAYIIHLVLSNYYNKKLDMSFRDYAIKKPNKAIVDLLGFAIKNIIFSRNIIIKTSQMTPDIIKEKLIQAYKLQSRDASTIETGDAYDIKNTLSIDPTYAYAAKIYKIMGKKVKPDDILGANWKDFDVIYKNVRIEPAKIIVKGAKDMVQNIQKNIVDSFNAFFGYIKDKVYRAPVYKSFTVKKEELYRYSEVYQKYKDECGEIKAREAEIIRRQQYYNQQPYGVLTNENPTTFKRRVLPLGRIYDEDGRRHDWSIFITSGQKTSELTLKDIIKARENGSSIEITDLKCGVCKVLRSQEGIFDDGKIKESLRYKNILNNFFRFYENRCPEGGMHDFDGDKCKKCAYTLGMKNQPEESKIYFKKYHAVFQKEQDEFRSVASEPAIKTAAEIALEVAPKTLEFTYDHAKIIELATALDINHRLIFSLGAVENAEYGDVASGKFVPAESEEKSDPRIEILISYISNLILQYNQLRYYGRLYKPPAFLAQIVDADISRTEINKLSELPDIFNGFNEKAARIKSVKKPQETVSFLLQYLCESLLEIYKSKLHPEICKKFVQHFIEKILYAEKMLTKPGYFSWSILYGGDVKESVDVNFIESEGESVQRGTEIKKELRDTEIEDPLGLDAFDYDEDPPDDETDGGVKVEGYGLD